MISFNPLDVIKSTDLNANFNELKAQTDKVPALKILSIVYNGVATRSTTTSNTYVTLPGATGDTSYTAPYDVRILFRLTQMSTRSGGTVSNFAITINGIVQAPATYGNEAINQWTHQSVDVVVDVDAGQTIAIGAVWKVNGGTLQVTNDNNNDDQFPNTITGVVVPR